MYPFSTPEAVVHRDHFSMVDVKKMHEEDGDLDVIFTEEDGEGDYDGAEEQPPSGSLKRKKPDARVGTHTARGANSGEQMQAVSEPGMQAGLAQGEQPQSASGEQGLPRAEGERAGGSAQGWHGLKLYRWTDGLHIPSTAQITLLSDAQLGRALAHHNFRLPL
eukprot:2066781-Rhodomonas_salina.1